MDEDVAAIMITNPNTLGLFEQDIEEALGSLSAEDRRQVTATNCARLYRFADAP